MQLFCRHPSLRSREHRAERENVFLGRNAEQGQRACFWEDDEAELRPRCSPRDLEQQESGGAGLVTPEGPSPRRGGHSAWCCQRAPRQVAPGAIRAPLSVPAPVCPCLSVVCLAFSPGLESALRDSPASAALAFKFTKGPGRETHARLA